MHPDIDEEWWEPAVSSDIYCKKIREKIDVGKVLMIHTHIHGDPCTTDCRVKRRFNAIWWEKK